MPDLIAPDLIASDLTAETPKKLWWASFKALGRCILAGLFLRQMASGFESELLAEVSNAVLFLPCSAAAVWAAWNLAPTTKSPEKAPWATALILAQLLCVACIARFTIASYPFIFRAPTIQGYCSPVAFWFGMQIAHWLGCFLVAFAIAKNIQWSCGVGIQPMQSTSDQPYHRNPGPLSIAKLGVVVTLCALAAFAYQQWFLSLAPGVVRTEDSPAWFQFFPVGSRPWAAGLVGGLLIPVHWFAIIGVLERTKKQRLETAPAKSHSFQRILLRTSLLALWCLVAAGLQAASSRVYFSNLILPPMAWSEPLTEWSTWMEYSIGHPYIVPTLLTPDDLPLGFYLFKAALQTCLVLASIAWIKGLGYHIGFQRLNDRR